MDHVHWSGAKLEACSAFQVQRWNTTDILELAVPHLRLALTHIFCNRNSAVHAERHAFVSLTY
jgi:hypothetical protein